MSDNTQQPAPVADPNAAAPVASQQGASIDMASVLAKIHQLEEVCPAYI